MSTGTPPSETQSVVVLGAGGIGCLLGARLAQHGLNITLLARPAHVDAIERRGLEVKEADGDTWSANVRAVPSLDELRGESFDLAVIAAKSFDTRTIVDAWANADVSGARVVCAQNGVRNEEIAAEVFDEVCAAVVRFGADMDGPGVVSARGASRLFLGSFPAGVQTWIEEFGSHCDKAGFDVATEDHVMETKWHKLVLNTESALSAVCDLRSDVITTDPNAVEYRRRLRTEATTALDAAGIAYAPVPEVSIEPPAAGARPSYASTWYDLDLKRHRVETPWLNGEIVRLGIQTGVPTPANALISELCQQMSDAGELPGKHRVEDLIGILDQGSSPTSSSL